MDLRRIQRPRTLALPLSKILFALTLMLAAGMAHAGSWKGQEVQKNGALHVVSPATGMETPVTVDLKELWRLGGESESEDEFFGIITQIETDAKGNIYALDTQLSEVKVYDTKGLWISQDQRVGLAHRRLAILDPRPDGAQPMWSIDGRYAIVFNGEIYNFRDLRAGLMHAGIFWGFVLLTIGTLNAVTGGLVEAVSIPFDGALWAMVTALQNAVAVVVIVSVAVAIYRRVVVRPARLTYSADAIVILLLIGTLVAAALLADAFEAAAYGPVAGAFIGNALAVPLEAIFGDACATLYGACWWLHIALVAAFLVYLPTSKHLHIATA